MDTSLIIETEYMEGTFEDTREESTIFMYVWRRPSEEEWEQHLADVKEYGEDY